MPLRPPLAEKRSQLHPLGFPSGESIRGLPKLDITKTHIAERPDLLKNILFILEEFQGFVDTHFKNLLYILVPVSHFQYLFLESFAAANFTGQVHVGQKLHLDNLFAFTFAGITTAAIHIERKMLGLN